MITDFESTRLLAPFGLKKIRGKFRFFFLPIFRFFQKKNPVEIYNMKWRLRRHSFMALGQTVRPVRVRTHRHPDRQTNFVSNIDLVNTTYLLIFSRQGIKAPSSWSRKS